MSNFTIRKSTNMLSIVDFNSTSTFKLKLAIITSNFNHMANISKRPTVNSQLYNRLIIFNHPVKQNKPSELFDYIYYAAETSYIWD